MPKVRINLLIGTTFSKAIEPWNFLASKNGGPFAIQTFAGRTIAGPLYMPSGERTEMDCRRIVAKEAGTEKLFEHHFMAQNKVKEVVSPAALNKMFEFPLIGTGG